jgi:hypothetical protein
LMIRDKRKFRQSVNIIMRWEIDKILVAHNQNVLEGDVKKELLQAFVKLGMAKNLQL